MEMVDYDKYVVNGVIQKEITLPTIAGKHVLVTDRFTATGAGTDTRKRGNYNGNYTIGVEKIKYEKMRRLQMIVEVLLFVVFFVWRING